MRVDLGGGVLRLAAMRRALLIVAAIAMIALLPMRLVFALAGGDAQAVSARSVHGSLWWGALADVQIGGVRLGDTQAALSPVQLLVGRFRFDLWRNEPASSTFRGGFTKGFNQRGIDDVTGDVPARAAFSPLPVSTIRFDDLTVHFANDRCSAAEGQVHLSFAGPFAGINLSQGMAGAAKCDGMTVLVPLSSQTGLEHLSIRIWRDGRTTMQMTVRGGQGVDDAGLSELGFRRVGRDNVLTFSGAM